MGDIALRGGFYTSDPRLDRLPQGDPQNANYPARRGLEGRKPRGYTHRVGVHLDQRSEGACVGFDFAHDLAAKPRMHAGVTDEYARQLYFDAQRIDPWEGGSYPGASPVYEGTSVLAGAKAARARGHFEEFQWAPRVSDLILAVGYKGPANLGIDWYSGMFNTNIDGFIKPTGHVAGGHAILCYSVSVKKGYFRLWNSWGPDWGEYGTAKVTFDDMAKLLENGAGEACIPVKRKTVALWPNG